MKHPPSFLPGLRNFRSIYKFKILMVFVCCKCCEKEAFLYIKTHVTPNAHGQITNNGVELGTSSFLVKEVKNRRNRARCEICLKSTIKTPERLHWCPYC